MAACSSQQEGPTVATTPVVTPTIHFIFLPPDTTSQQAATASAATAVALTTDLEELPPLPTLTPQPNLVRRILAIYGESLNPNWTLEHSQDMVYDLREEEFVYNGRYALAATPQEEFGKLRFTVSENASAEYLRDEVLAFRFWLYSEEFIGIEDIGITIMGSNDYPYWVADDNSVQPDDNLEVFIPTRLQFLNIESDIPPNTWVQVEIWLNDLLFDPTYRYVTGIIIENDAAFSHTFYLDGLEMVIQES